MSKVFVAIIGAGASGLAAARTLVDDFSVPAAQILLLEGDGRVGGRAWSDGEFCQFPFEKGAEFIHGDLTTTHRFLARLGASATPTTDLCIPVDRYGNVWWAEGTAPALHVESLSEPLRSRIRRLKQVYHDLVSSGTPLASDLSLRSYLSQRIPDITEEEFQIADVLFCQTCCASIDWLSCNDLIEEARHDNSGGPGESRPRCSYSDLFTSLAKGLSIRFTEVVTRVDYSSPTAITIHTKAGTVIEAKNCIITSSIGVLQSGLIDFTPALPSGHSEAIGRLKMLAGTKVSFKFSKRFWSKNLTYMCHTGLFARWWTPGYHRDSPDSDKIISCYVTADRAEAVDRMTEDEVEQKGLQELGRCLGVAAEELAANLLAFKRIPWKSNVLARGAYVSAPVGAWGTRAQLAEPISCPGTPSRMLLFAGEAVAVTSNFQTVHGALDSGIRAATLLSALLPNLR